MASSPSNIIAEWSSRVTTTLGLWQANVNGASKTSEIVHDALCHHAGNALVLGWGAFTNLPHADFPTGNFFVPAILNTPIAKPVSLCQL